MQAKLFLCLNNKALRYVDIMRVDVVLNIFLNLVLFRDEGSAQLSGCFTPSEIALLLPIGQETVSVPEPVSTIWRSEKLLPG
jgi:hypothetical protein